MKQALALRHVMFENLSLLEPILRQHGYDIDYLHAGVDPITARQLAEPDLLIVLGGPLGVYEQETFPWLVAEQDAIGQRLQAARPTLGLCLGAQLMAQALGAHVGPGAAKEIGYGPVSLTPEGQASPLGAIDGLPVLHWHGDGFAVPDGATRLAFSANYPAQAFGLDNWGLALQFHLEVEPAWLETWLIANCFELGREGLSIPDLRAEARRVDPVLRPAAQRVFDGWLEAL
ncbi:MAG: glutamine amidotransferase [Bifidobacteriaceae bacterium]|jgi:GMP synthase (glutamine-hydrolysing)|nr:glutamine amidotransferase [Bifidobacteriaceae bacterium]